MYVVCMINNESSTIINKNILFGDDINFIESKLLLKMTQMGTWQKFIQKVIVSNEP